jgi:hypothetical protein
MGAKPLLISLGTAVRCLSDPRFFEALPEFMPLRAKMMTQNAVVKHSGCSGCSQRRMAQSTGVDFIRLASSLPADRIARLKNFLGTDAILINGMNPVTKRYESRVI